MSKYLIDNNLNLDELHEQHGTALRVNMGLLGGGWHLAINDAEAVREIISTDHTRFESKWPGEALLLPLPISLQGLASPSTSFGLVNSRSCDACPTVTAPAVSNLLAYPNSSATRCTPVLSTVRMV